MGLARGSGLHSSGCPLTAIAAVTTMMMIMGTQTALTTRSMYFRAVDGSHPFDAGRGRQDLRPRRPAPGCAPNSPSSGHRGGGLCSHWLHMHSCISMGVKHVGAGSGSPGVSWVSLDCGATDQLTELSLESRNSLCGTQFNGGTRGVGPDHR